MCQEREVEENSIEESVYASWGLYIKKDQRKTKYSNQ